MLILPPRSFPSLASHAHGAHSYLLKILSLSIYFLLKHLSVSPLPCRPAFKPHPSCYLALSKVLSNATSYSCLHKSWTQASWTPVRHSVFLDPCLWLSHLSLWLSKFDPSFNAHWSGPSNNRALTDTAPFQNFPHPHCLCLASHQMLPCIIIWQSIHKVLIVEAVPYVSFGSGPLLGSLVKESCQSELNAM